MAYLRLCAILAKDIFAYRKLLWTMTKKDFKDRYLGSYLGVLWAFIQPLVTVMIFWFVFQVGFKSMPIDNVPFILWMIAGMFPWFFISDGIANATNAIVDNAYLVKKVVFRVSLLPLIKIISAIMVHLFFIALLFVFFFLYGYGVSIYQLQLIYYLFGAVCLVCGFSMLTSTLVVFMRDIGQLVAMVLQFGFWMTPVFWSARMIPEKYLPLLKLNPCYYIVEGYRNCFIYRQWFWQDGWLTIYFWVFIIVLLLCGGALFKKLRPHFADVL